MQDINPTLNNLIASEVAHHQASKAKLEYDTKALGINRRRIEDILTASQLRVDMELYCQRIH